MNYLHLSCVYFLTYVSALHCSTFQDLFSFCPGQLYSLESVSLFPCISLASFLNVFLLTISWLKCNTIPWFLNSCKVFIFVTFQIAWDLFPFQAATGWLFLICSFSIIAVFRAVCAGLLEPQFWFERMRVRWLCRSVGSLEERSPWMSALLTASLRRKGTKSVGRLLRKNTSGRGLSEKGLGRGGSGFSLGLKKGRIKWREGQGFGAGLYGQVMKNHWQFSPIKGSVLPVLWWQGTRLPIAEASICWIALPWLTLRFNIKWRKVTGSMSTLVCSSQRCAFGVTVLTVLISSWFTSENGPAEHLSINWILSRQNKTGMWATASYPMKQVWCTGPDEI